MKTFLVIVLLLILTILSAISVSAAPVVLYLDTLPSGTVDKNGHAALVGEDDLTTTIISGGTMFDKFKVGAEYGTGTIEEDTGDNDFSIWGLKGGYRFFDARATKLDAIIAVLEIDTEKSKLDGTLVGVDFTQYFSEKAFLSGSYVFAIDGSHEHDVLKSDDDVPISLLRLKFNYLVAEKLGLALGYTDLRYKVDHSTPVSGRLDVSLGGISLGVFYIF